MLKTNKTVSLSVLTLSTLLSFSVSGYADTKVPTTRIPTAAAVEEDSEKPKSGFHPGDILQGSSSTYTVIEQLGEGAFGQVYAVEDESGEKYAIKHYKHTDNGFGLNHAYNDAEREFKRGQLLDHPHIVKSVDLFPHLYANDEESLVLVLEYVEGQPVFKIKRSTFTKQQVVDVIVNLVDALKYAMTYDLFHLDLHGGNVMIDANDNPKVIDLASFFELKELISSLPQSSEESDAAPSAAKRLAPPRKAIPAAIAQKHPKIAKFIEAHPKVARQLAKRVDAEKGKRAAKGKPRYHKSLVSNAAANTDEAGNLSESVKAPLLAYYFNMISDICATMIYLSDLDKDQKINLHAEIKKISWSYDYDINEGLTPDFDEYVNQMTSLLIEY